MKAITEQVGVRWLPEARPNGKEDVEADLDGTWRDEASKTILDGTLNTCGGYNSIQPEARHGTQKIDP